MDMILCLWLEKKYSCLFPLSCFTFYNIFLHSFKISAFFIPSLKPSINLHFFSFHYSNIIQRWYLVCKCFFFFFSIFYFLKYFFFFFIFLFFVFLIFLFFYFFIFFFLHFSFYNGYTSMNHDNQDMKLKLGVAQYDVHT